MAMLNNQMVIVMVSSGESWVIVGYPLVNMTKKLWKYPPFFMGKSTISMAIFNSYVCLPEGTYIPLQSHNMVGDVDITNSAAWNLPLFIPQHIPCSIGYIRSI